MSTEYKVLIGGEWAEAASGARANVINPATGQVIASVPKCDTADVDRAVGAALKAAPGWAAKTVAERSKVLLKLAQVIMAHHEELAKLETMEHGHPYARR